MAKTSYDDIAEWYDEAVRNGSLIHDLVVPGIFSLSGEVDGLHVCDLGCGQGLLSRQLAIRGATVVGVDISPKLLEIARRDEAIEPLNILYVQDDAQTLATLGDALFDGVLCNMALMDIPDLPATFRAVYRILRPHGWFIFSITHPCFQTSGAKWIDEPGVRVRRVVAAYFEEGFWRSEYTQGVRGKVGAYHRTLGTYINSLTTADLAIECILEPQAQGQSAETIPGYREVPAVLIARCRKA